MSELRPKGLGKGLSALLGDSPPPVADAASGTATVREIELARIRPNPDQPRKHFDEASLVELAESIAERGVLQPILVRPRGDGFEIVAGERRWRAAQRAGVHRIPALIRDSGDEATAEIALIENVQRQDLNPLEEARGYRQLIERFGHRQEAVAKLVHKSRSHVANLMRLLDLPESVQQALLRGDITMGHARAAAGSADPEALIQEVIARGLSVRQTEARAKRARAAPGELVLKDRALDADLAALERQLADLLGLRVELGHRGSAGTVTLHYSSLDQLDMICQRLSGEPI